ncbi:MAG TPA: alkaline phosphatase family protein [Gemmataceae bacterium]|nr:alkaline phosphatase family protein [Gemmataceae bacterium]
MSRRLALLLTLVAAPTFAAEPERPRLVVLVVFDQMRGDYLEKWKPLFGSEGFVRMQTEGAWFTNCHYQYAYTVTGPGHASMLTGCGPDVHGIIGNTWYDRASGAVVNCSESDRYGRVPPLPKDLPKDEVKEEVKAKEATEKKDPDAEEEKKDDPEKKAPAPKKANGTPDRLLAPTFADALKSATGGKGKAIGLSFKDRSAVLPVGPKADGAYWLDSTDGLIVTSTYFRDTAHPWVAELNKSRIADRWFEKDWSRFVPDLDYVRYSGPDDVAGEGRGSRQGRTFPHRTDGGLKRPGKAYYEALYNSPYGNDFLLELVKTAIVAEKLGQHDVPDLLAVSFSSNDIVGHTWGPDSQEVLDVTLRSDRLMADFLRFLDETVGKGKYLICLTADHGICPIPEVSAKRGLEAKRLSATQVRVAADEYLRSVYDEPGSKTRWIENATGPWWYLNHKLIESRGLKVADVADTLAGFLGKVDGVQRAFTRADLEVEMDPYDDIGHRVKKSYHPDRCGDVAVVLKPYWFDGNPKFGTGTTHGSPYAYDTHVPLLVFGPNVKPGVRKDEVVPATIASIFAKALGIAPPAKAEYSVPEGLFRD